MEILRYFNLSIILFFGLVWIGAVWFLRFKKNKNFLFLICFTVFYIYIIKFLDYTLFQFQSLLLLKHFIPGLMLKGLEPTKSLNFIPIINLTPQDLKTSLLNILLFIPFGFGLPFIVTIHWKKVIISGALFSIGIEILQFMTGVLARTTFRIADINDVIFNTLGVAIGYMFFYCLL